jgi:hypothetical protein
MACRPEFDRQLVHLQRLTALSPSRAQAEELWAYVRTAGPALRQAGCGTNDEHRLLLPAVLQLLLLPTVDESTKNDLRRWVEAASETNRTRAII